MLTCLLLILLCLLVTIPPSQACSPSPGLSAMTYKDFYYESALVWKLEVLFSRAGRDARIPDDPSPERTLYFCRVRKIFKGCRLRKEARYVWLATPSDSALCGGFLNTGTILIMLKTSSTSPVLLDPPSRTALRDARPDLSGPSRLPKSFRATSNRRMYPLGVPAEWKKPHIAVAANSFVAQGTSKAVGAPSLAEGFLQPETRHVLPTPSPSLSPSPSASPSSNLDNGPVEAYYFSAFTYQQLFMSVSRKTNRFLRRNRNLMC